MSRLLPYFLSFSLLSPAAEYPLYRLSHLYHLERLFVLVPFNPHDARLPQKHANLRRGPQGVTRGENVQCSTPLNHIYQNNLYNKVISIKRTMWALAILCIENAASYIRLISASLTCLMRSSSSRCLRRKYSRSSTMTLTRYLYTKHERGCTQEYHTQEGVHSGCTQRVL